LIIDPQELWFEGTLQGTVLLLAEKTKSPNSKKYGAAVSSIKSLDDVKRGLSPRFKKAIFSNHSGLECKWMSLLLTKSERDLLNDVKKHPQVARFVNLASVDVGIVTGANKFFLVSDSVVDEFGLHEWVHPMFGRSDHLKGLVHTNENQNENQASGLPSNFLYFDVDNYETLPKNVQLYIDSGVDQNLQKRFKCRNRSPWFKVPSVYKTPLAMLKRAHHYPRLVLNQAKSYSTDTAYRVTPTTTTAAETLVGNFVNSLTCLSAELEGRSYGGGVLELVPSEIERLLIPHVTLKKTLAKRNQEFIGKKSADIFLLEQDKEILMQGLGMSEADTHHIHSAWNRLRNRRQRRS
jgi:adenine-specific DNA methylase